MLTSAACRRGAGASSPVRRVTASGLQTTRFPWDPLPRPLLRPQPVLSLPPEWPAAPSPSQALRLRELEQIRAEARAAYSLRECVHRCGQSSRQVVGAGWEDSPRRQGPGQGLHPGQAVPKHLGRYVTVFRSQRGPWEGSQARLRSLPFWTHYDRWSSVLPCPLGLAGLLPSSPVVSF